MNADPSDDDHTSFRSADSTRVHGAQTTAFSAEGASDFGYSSVLEPGTYMKDFEIEGVLGEGGFGIVYLATDHSLGRKVALKEYMPAALATRAKNGHVQVRSERLRDTFETGLKSFINEAKLLASFDHPSLLKVYRFWEQAGTAYMAMPYVEGKTLKRALRELGRPPDEAWLLRLLGPLTEALQAIHSAQCYHRDIAPDNVMILPGSERPLLLDFGAARRVVSDKTQTLTVILKSGYAPVEQYADTPGMRQGAWTDVYALGAMVHFAILGNTPPTSVGRLVKDSYLPLVQAAAGRYSHAFLSAIDHALAVHPDHRTRSITQFRVALGLEKPTALAHGDADADPLGAGDAGIGRQPRNAVETPHNLAMPTSVFVGRERERRDLQEQFKTARLVTLVGMGGLGKTRLALQIGNDLLTTFTGGVWFLDVTPLRSDSILLAQLAQCLGVREDADRSLLQSLLAHLATSQVLLILDGCEHSLASVAHLCALLQSETAGVHVLVSSREALKLAHEVIYPVLPLPLPQTGAGVEALLAISSAALFVARAQEHRRNFMLTDKEAPAVVELVQRLEGIPLALELAAARIRTMSLTDINQRLHDRFRVLSKGGEEHNARQQTLRAMVDWSYESLDDGEKFLFNRLSVFVGGASLEAAETVCGTAPLLAHDVMDLLSNLVDKSLVMLDERDQLVRYRMLETIRLYGSEKLGDIAERDVTASAHGHYFFSYAKQVRSGLLGADQGDWVRRGEADIDNLRATIAMALRGGLDPVISVKMAVALQGLWVLRGSMAEGRSVVQEALRLPQVTESPNAHAHALYVGAALALVQGDYDEAQAQLITCLALRRELGNPADVAATLSTLSKVQLYAIDPQALEQQNDGRTERRQVSRGQTRKARASATEALTLLRQLGDATGEAIALQDLGNIEYVAGQLDAARTCMTQSLHLARQANHPETEAECEMVLGTIAMETSDLPAARVHLLRSRAICERSGDRRGAACAKLWLGKLSLLTGEVHDAKALLGQALQACQAYEIRSEWLECLLIISALATQINAWDEAQRLASATAALIRRLRLSRSAASARFAQQLDQQLEKNMWPESRDLAVEEGHSWTLQRATDCALHLCA